jgi:RHS repeat-associated protein
VIGLICHPPERNRDARSRPGTTQDANTPAAHDCSSTQATGSDSYLYDDNDNRTKVSESNGSASSDQRYCLDALNRLQYRQTGSACSSSSKNEEYAYDKAGNRTKTVISGTTTNYAYNAKGQLCKVGATSCGTPTCAAPYVTYDSAGRTACFNGWAYVYDAEGRLIKACESTTCATSGVDKVEFAYDGEGHRTSIKEYTAGTLTTTRDFLYQGDAIVQEKTNGTISREYVVDEAGAIIRFCDPSCTSVGNTSYLVTWNGHGDALAAWKIDPSTGSLTLANSYTYSSWGAPTTATHNSIADLGLRFLYVGRFDVQWDNFSGLGLLYMHARHYAPSIGRFLQPDPAAAEANHYAYTASNPVTAVDPSGLYYTQFAQGGGTSASSMNGATGGNEDLARIVPPLLLEAAMWLLPVGWLGKVKWIAEAAKWLFRGRSVTNGTRLAYVLHKAARTRGFYGLGRLTRSEADDVGRAWVGPSYRTAGPRQDILISADGLRQYRPPAYKPSLGRTQANVESRSNPFGQWVNNGHIDIVGQ